MECLFVGAGAIAAEYAAGLPTSSLSLAGVVDLDTGRADAFASAQGCPAYTDLETALEAVDAPLVVNLTSHAAHAAVTRMALTAGRHVYSQKPLALDAETAADLLALAAANDLALGCAPATPRAPGQRRAGRLLAEGRLGPVQLGYAYAHVGRVADWHDRPDSFLQIGPLYDGAVYPLTLLTTWFGPVERVRVADALDIWPDRASQRPKAPSHVEATLEFAAGPVVRLTASFYAPHRSREFYGLELHGDDGSLSLRDAGAMADSEDLVRFGGLGREYTAVPPQFPTEPVGYLDALERLAAGIQAGKSPRKTGRRGAHIVAVCNAIESAATDGGSIEVDDHGMHSDPAPDPRTRLISEQETADTEPGASGPARGHALRLPPIGFGCSRYRDGEYVDRIDAIATALDTGYRLLDSAELYGNEHRIGDVLASPGAPDRESLFLVGKVWRTNHQRDHLLQACRGSLNELDIDAFDCYMLHWPEAWEHRGPLDRLAEKSVDRQEALTFPETESGEMRTTDLSLADAWANLEAVHERGLTRSLGVCNVSIAQLERILDRGTVPPAVVQFERHPYRPREDLVSFCHDHGMRVVAHSPLSAPGLLDEPELHEVADEYDLSPAGAVLAWNVTRGVVPIPSSNTDRHIVTNLAAASTRLGDDAMERIRALQDPDFTR